MSAYFRCVCLACGWASGPMLEDAKFPDECPECAAPERHLRMEVRLAAAPAAPER